MQSGPEIFRRACGTHSSKYCWCGGHNASNAKRNLHHHATRQRLTYRALRRMRRISLAVVIWLITLSSVSAGTLAEWPGAIAAGEHFPFLRRIPPAGQYAVVCLQYRPYDELVYCPIFRLNEQGTYDRARVMPSDLGPPPCPCNYFLLYDETRQVWDTPGRN